MDPYLIPGHLYLFKIAHGWRAQQLWSEVIAYRIAALVRLDVPRCFIGVDGRIGEVGSLSEFFYGFPGDLQPHLIHAADVLQRFRTGLRNDRPHFIRLNLMVCRALKLTDPVSWWARVLAFDALIGNSDRHPENWGFLERVRHGDTPVCSFAPIFDNGTSMGYELDQGKLREASEPGRLANYIDKGRHHCGWDLSSDSPTPHMDLCRQMLAAYHDAREEMRSVIAFDTSRLANIAAGYTACDIPEPLTDDRARFISTLIQARQRRLAAMIGD